MADVRPANCRFRLQEEGRMYPRSSCVACGRTITTGLGRQCHVEPDEVDRLRAELAAAERVIVGMRDGIQGAYDALTTKGADRCLSEALALTPAKLANMRLVPMEPTEAMDLAGVTAAAEVLGKWAEDYEASGEVQAVIALILSGNSLLTRPIYRAMIGEGE